MLSLFSNMTVEAGMLNRWIDDSFFVFYMFDYIFHLLQQIRVRWPFMFLLLYFSAYMFICLNLKSMYVQ